jgi:hypothetical protein
MICSYNAPKSGDIDTESQNHRRRDLFPVPQADAGVALTENHPPLIEQRQIEAAA